MDLFKDLIWDNLIEAALSSLFAALPFLNFWPINVAIRYIIMEFTTGLYIGLAQFIDTTMIPIKNEQLKIDYQKAQVKLKIIAGGRGIESEEFKNARIEHKDYLRKHLRIGPRAA